GLDWWRRVWTDGYGQEGTQSRWLGEEGGLRRLGGVRRRAEAAPRPRDRSRGAERCPRGHARDEEPRPRRGRPLEAVASERHRPRATGHKPRPPIERRCWRR